MARDPRVLVANPNWEIANLAAFTSEDVGRLRARPRLLRPGLPRPPGRARRGRSTASAASRAGATRIPGSFEARVDAHLRHAGRLRATYRDGGLRAPGGDGHVVAAALAARARSRRGAQPLRDPAAARRCRGARVTCASCRARRRPTASPVKAKRSPSSASNAGRWRSRLEHLDHEALDRVAVEVDPAQRVELVALEVEHHQVERADPRLVEHVGRACAPAPRPCSPRARRCEAAGRVRAVGPDLWT